MDKEALDLLLADQLSTPLGPLSSTKTEGMSPLFITISLRPGITPDTEQVLSKYL